MTDGMLSAAEIADRLGLKRHPRSWRGACPACSYPGAFSVKAGQLGRSVLYCAAGCSFIVLADAVARRLGNFGQPLPKPQQDPDVAEARARRLATSERQWRGSASALGSPVAAYLASRGLAGLEHSLALRFRGDASHPELGGRLPAMVAQVVDAAGRHIGVHRTYLRADGCGKAEVTPDKATLGPTWGGAVRIDPAAAALVVGEGIESAASAGRMLQLSAWAALSAGNLAKGLQLPPEVTRVTIAVDHDLPTRDGKHPGQDAADAAAARWRAEGRQVRLLMPDELGTDFNDLLLRQTANG